MAIFWIYPAYQDMQLKRADLKSAVDKLVDIQNKNAKAEKLHEAWNTNLEQRSVITQYIPEQKQEEDVINNLNALVSASGASIYNLSVSAVGKNKTAVAEDEANKSALVPTAKSFEVTLGAAGDYKKIKTLLGKINSFPRFNGISSLKIAKTVEKDKSNEGANGNLQADIVLSFNYMEKNNSTIKANDKIFLSENFDMSIADVIKKKLETAFNAISIGSAGRENPFVK